MARERKKEETPSFLLVERVIESYFNKQLRNKYRNIKENDTILKVETERLKCSEKPFDEDEIKFANSKLLDIWADCSDNFEVNKLREQILEEVKTHNKQYEVKLKKIQEDYKLIF